MKKVKLITKLKRQLARAREDKAELEIICSYWKHKANEHAIIVEYWKNMAKRYKADRDSCNELIDKNFATTNNIMNIAINLLEKNREAHSPEH